MQHGAHPSTHLLRPARLRPLRTSPPPHPSGPIAAAPVAAVQPYKLQLKRARYVFGFARAGQLSAAEYAQVAPDPVLAFSAPVASHMNDDHAESTVAMIRHYVGLAVESATITSVDSYGMFVKVARAAKAEPDAKPGRPGAPPAKEEFKMRLPFPRKAESRKDVKDLIVEMTRASASA
jgi:hypothetical protein